MKKIFLYTAALVISLSCSCSKPGSGSGDDTPEPSVSFVKGADISWYTEMESNGYKFYNASGKERSCPELMKELGFNALRFRVWVDPADDWCGKEDLLVKCLKAKELGMKIMVDFHYSDSWADPGKQNVPAAWLGSDINGLLTAVKEHTTDVLTMLRNAGVDVAWVQVGNEVTNGMLWETGRVKGSTAGAFARLFNAGAKAVKAVYPDAQVMIHTDNAWNYDTQKWFYDLMASNNVAYDIIGLSLYPSYWDDKLGNYLPWEEKTKAAVENIGKLNGLFHKPVMLVEFGMPASWAAEGKAALTYLLENLTEETYFKGIFFWEPESEHDRNGYDYGAFNGGKPTEALSPISKY